MQSIIEIVGLKVSFNRVICERSKLLTFDWPPTDSLHFAAQCTDDTFCQRVVKAERTTDREHALANLKV